MVQVYAEEIVVLKDISVEKYSWIKVEIVKELAVLKYDTILLEDKAYIVPSNHKALIRQSLVLENPIFKSNFKLKYNKIDYAGWIGANAPSSNEKYGFMSIEIKKDDKIWDIAYKVDLESKRLIQY